MMVLAAKTCCCTQGSPRLTCNVSSAAAQLPCANQKFFRLFVRWMTNLNAAPRYQVLVLCGGGACHANSGSSV